MASWEPTCTVEALRARAEILGLIRAFFAERGVLEVQTPTLGRTSVSDTEIESLTTTGGEFLQTSPEYYMKRLLAAGAPSIYQIGPAYRAGESGRTHLTEFTLVEWYRLGFDDDALMAEVAALIDSVLGPAPYRHLTHAELLATQRDEGAEPDLRFGPGRGESRRNPRIHHRLSGGAGGPCAVAVPRFRGGRPVRTDCRRY